MRRVIVAVLIVVVALAALYLFMVLPGKAAGDKLDPFKRTPIAHRGLFDNKSDAPENSLTAFQRAIDAGLAIELDVQLSADGTVMVSHDKSQQRVTGTDRTLSQLSDTEVAGLRLFGTDQGIPTFAEALDLIDGQVPLLVELKVGAEGNAPALAAAAAELLDEYHGAYAVQSFNPLALRWFMTNRPRVPRGLLAADFVHYRPPDSEDPPTGIAAVALANMLGNFLCRPNFIAYEKTGFEQPTLQLVRRITTVDCLAWTVRSETDLQLARAANVGGYVFDSFTPPTG